jgi:hypothetical protein
MNAQRIPTQAQNAHMVRMSRQTIRQQRGLERYVEVQAMRPEPEAPVPVNFCAVEPATESVWSVIADYAPETIRCVLAIGLWLAFGYGCLMILGVIV